MNFPGAVLLTPREDPNQNFYWLPPEVDAYNFAYNVSAGSSGYNGGAAPTMVTYASPMATTGYLALMATPSRGVYAASAGHWHWLSQDQQEVLVPTRSLAELATETAKAWVKPVEPKTLDTTDIAHEPMTADPAKPEVSSADPLPNPVGSQRLGRINRLRPRRTAVTSRRLTGLAVFIAGHRRGDLSDEWRSHLSGESGAGLPSRRQAQEAAGFVLAAVRYRLQDVTDLAWRPVDSLLESRELSNLTVVLATLVIVVFFLRRGGVNDLADHLECVPVAPASALWVINCGKRYRQVKPPKRKPRRGRQ